MPNYYVNNQAQANGEHEIHADSCKHLPKDTTPLGNYITCEPALRAAKLYYERVNGCRHCSKACHAVYKVGSAKPLEN